MAHKGKSKNGQRKYGRNLAKCLRYRNRNTRIKNKVKKLKKAIKQQPNNLTLIPILKRYENML